MSSILSILGFAAFLILIVALGSRGRASRRNYEGEASFSSDDGAADVASGVMIGADSGTYSSPDMGNCSSNGGADAGSCSVDSTSSF